MKLCKKVFAMFILVFMALLTLVSCGDNSIYDTPNDGIYSFTTMSITGDEEIKSMLDSTLNIIFERSSLKIEGTILSFGYNGNFDEAYEFKMSRSKMIPVDEDKAAEMKANGNEMTVSGNRIILSMEDLNIFVKVEFTKQDDESSNNDAPAPSDGDYLFKSGSVSGAGALTAILEDQINIIYIDSLFRVDGNMMSIRQYDSWNYPCEYKMVGTTMIPTDAEEASALSKDGVSITASDSTITITISTDGLIIELTYIKQDI